MRTQTKPATIRPKITLVLGSGGVKSIAGLGALQVLEDHGLPPDAVVGCSAGALFGALVAVGHNAQQAMVLARTLWSRNITSQRRLRAWLELALPRLAGFDQRFALRDDRLIRQQLQAAFGDLQIQNLRLPLQVQASDAETGASVVLRHGPLAEALRASIALPFLFAPQCIGGRWLVDGSLSDPLPLGLAPADHVQVAVGFRVPCPRCASSASRLATRSTAALSNNLLDARTAAADTSRLVLMLPALPQRIGLFDTEAMPALIEIGRQAALAALPRLQALLGTGPRLAAMAG
ncbi:MAG: patatin-like phospholipase family protein [Aquabacterium sp.]|nr:patatin-like phospholipase family protein [Aquabacterium sp.]